MKLLRYILLISTLVGSSASGEAKPNEEKSTEIHKQVDQLMKQRKADEPAPLLEKALEVNPKDTKALGRLGMIYILMLNQPEKAKAFSLRGWKLGDVKCLQSLAISYIATNDHAGIKNHEEDFLNNFEKLSGSKIICFFIAGKSQDEKLFKALLRRTTDEEIERDKTMAKWIARTAKLLAKNGR
jgi:hypothetical protein